MFQAAVLQVQVQVSDAISGNIVRAVSLLNRTNWEL